MTYIKVNNTLYPAMIDGKTVDYAWDKRETKSITLNMTYADALALLPDNTPWSIVQDVTDMVEDDGGDITETAKQVEYDNSEYCMSGAITDNRDGTVTIKMGKPTEIETVRASAITEIDLENAYKEGVNSI